MQTRPSIDQDPGRESGTKPAVLDRVQELTHPPAGPGFADRVTEVISDESAPGADLWLGRRVEPLVAVGQIVSQGQALLSDRNDRRVMLAAPVAGRVARLDLAAGRRLRELVLFHEAGGDRRRFDITGGEHGAEIRRLMLDSGLWTTFRSRPGGRFPSAGSSPAAIFVVAAQTRPGSISPRRALVGNEVEFHRGLDALRTLTAGPVFLLQDSGEDLAPDASWLHRARAAAQHPGGLAGGHVHRLCPASPDRPVWDIEAQDVAALGELITTGYLPVTRLVALSGTGLRGPRLVRTQAGADLRALVRGALTPGPKTILSGGLPDGVESRYLRAGDRQAAVLPLRTTRPRGHWFGAALTGAARPVPIIPSAALFQSIALGTPAMPLLRALAAGDDETAIRLGALSLVEEDLALVDHVTAAAPPMARMLRALLDRVAAREHAG